MTGSELTHAFITLNTTDPGCCFFQKPGPLFVSSDRHLSKSPQKEINALNCVCITSLTLFLIYLHTNYCFPCIHSSSDSKSQDNKDYIYFAFYHTTNAQGSEQYTAATQQKYKFISLLLYTSNDTIPALVLQPASWTVLCRSFPLSLPCIIQTSGPTSFLCEHMALVQDT